MKAAMFSGSSVHGPSIREGAHRVGMGTWYLILSVLLLLPLSAGAATAPFSHDVWQTVLEEFVDDEGLVDYQGLAGQREVFDGYIEAIESSSPANRPELFPTPEHSLAYYLNAYNAQVFNGVLARGPERISVWRGAVSGLKFFVRMKVVIGGEKMSLKRLEDELIREKFQDPRIHAALNCASISCPRLRRTAFRAESLQEELEEAMREFVADPRNCRVSPDERKVYLSGIFDFFPKDFLRYEQSQGNPDPRLSDYINRFRGADGQIPRDYKIEYLKYDKGINQQ
ncbi:MAG: DUF547 domain-containing protein [Deltaproteobacteria bacterium]|nr:DUF547 domain-containing protein [Deltaproteobacteria bacterium]